VNDGERRGITAVLSDHTVVECGVLRTTLAFVFRLLSLGLLLFARLNNSSK
jgi:hypothetical protein